MSETVAWLLPCAIVALYVVWAFAYDGRSRPVETSQGE